MDFDDTPEEAAFRQEARSWLSAHLPPRPATKMDAYFLRRPITTPEVQASREYQAIKAKDGYAAITWPRAYGGYGGSLMQQVIWNQEEGRFLAPVNVFHLGIGLAGPTIMTHGTEAQKKRFLSRILTAEIIFCQLFSEPAAGSDLAGLRTRAVRDGDRWIINGQKVWNSLAHIADWGILVTRSDPNVPKHKGLTYFIVDMHSPGVEVRPIKQITGGATFNEVFLTDVVIPDENRVGAVGEGWRVALTTLMNERMLLGAGRQPGPDTGAILDLAARCMIQGRPAIEDSSVRQELAELITQQEALRLTGYRALTALSQGRPPGPEGSIGKLAVAQLMQRIGSVAMGLQGAAGAVMGEGSMDEGLWQEMFLASAGTRIAGGTDEIQRNIIGERLLGLPADMRLDKDRPFSEIPTSTRAQAG
jgi:alkylation response protein AidB-like acyl-CoA dehydrogenase